MATIVNQTDWTFTRSVGVTTQSVTIPSTTAGATLVLVACGGAQVTAKITNTSGAAFTSRTQALGGQAVSIHDFTAVGGETAVFLTLNGAENISGTIYEVSGLGAFVAASNNGTGVSASSTNDFQAKPASAVSLASGSGVVFGAWSVTATAATQPFSGVNQWRQMGPSGLLRSNAANQPGANTQFVWASGTADVTSSARWPENGAAAGNYQATSVWVAGGTCFAAQALYANSGAAINPTVNAIVAENRIPGTHSGNWYAPTAMVNANIAGYCDKVSYQPGDTVNFKVDSNNVAHRVEIYRLGYYGWENFGARNVLGAQGGYITATPAVQGSPSVDSTLGSTSCAWTTTASWTVPSTATPGVYYVLFRSTVTPANVASGHFVVRPSAATGKAAVVIPDMTHQAYNTWGARTDTTATTGRSLYSKGDDTPSPNFAHRAYAVSWDRPYATQAFQANTYLFDSEHGWIVFAEAQGYDLTYFSDWDLDGSTSLLNDASAVVMLGHSEYWTTGVYDGFTNAVDAGVNMMVVSSNTALWRCRFAAADTGKRTLICYKDSATRDVAAGHTGTGYDPVLPTGTWRDALATNGVANPDRRVEDALTGQIFKVSAPAAVAMTVPFASKTKPIWRNSASVQALTTGNSYTTTQTVIGDEVDYASGGATQPTNLVSLSPTSMSSSNGANANGTIYSGSTGAITVGFTLYRRSSGALIFNTGAWRGWEGVSRFARSTNASTVTAPTLDWQNALLAVLYDLGVTPTAARALRPGTDSAPTNPATGAPTGGRNAVALAYGLTVPATGFNQSFFAALLADGATTTAISHGKELTSSITGIPAGTTLTTSSIGTSSITAGTYTDVSFSPTDFCRISADSSTFIRCRFLGGTLLSQANGNTFTNCDFPGGLSVSSSNNNTFTRCRMHTAEDDVSHITGDQGAAPLDQCSSIAFVECLFDDAVTVGPNHADGMQVRGSDGLILRRCKLDMGAQVAGPDHWKNAALYLQDANGGNDNVLVEDCYLNGGGYSLYLQAMGGTSVFTGNRWGPDLDFGRVNNSGGVVPTTWTGNVIDATGVAVPYTTN